MRRLVIVLAVFWSVHPAFALKGISVAELEKRLDSNRGKADVDVARQLAEFELTERLSATTLTRLQSVAPGAKTSQELTILADQSTFLSLPAAEIPAIPTPDLAAQREIMNLVVTYLSKTIHQLPNFYATRVTTHFEETPQIQTPMYAIPYKPLHQTNAFRVTVLYRDGQEVVDAGEKAKRAKQQEKGLHDWGVFGPILSTVFLDAAKSDLSWSRWEQVPTGTQAVFRYAVPLQNSHYRANFCCVLGSDPISDPSALFDHIVGYRGEISVDPKRGSILRITVRADLKPSDPISRADIMVEYGSVEIGGQTYVCATRSVALSVALSSAKLNNDWASDATVVKGPPQKLLNDVAFEQYHMFRTQARILSGDAPTQPDAPPADTSASATPPETATPPPTPQPAINAEDHSATSATAPADTAAQQTPAAQTAATEPSPAPATSAETAPPPTNATPIFKTATHQVLVDVVATKNNGEPQLGLGKQDFEIRENGKPQTIDFFQAHTTSATAPGEPPQMPALPTGAFTNVPPAPPADAVNVLLIDTLNTDTQDQSYLRSQVMGFFNKMQPGTRMAIFVLGSKLTCLQGFTSDSSALLAALNNQPSGSKAEKSALLQTRSDRAGDASALAMLQTMQSSPFTIQAFQSALAGAGARDFGARASMTFQALMYLGHYLSGVPGRKNLIWFAGSFPVAIFPTPEQIARMKQNPSLPGYVDHVRATADLFTASQIAVYPISAEGMMVEHIAEAEAGGPGSGDPGHIGAQAESTMAPYKGAADARAGAIDAMNQLASSTGGKAYYNTNDLAAALKHAVDDGANYYTIGYSLADRKMDGSYRQIEVKLLHGKEKLAYRHGYNADDSPASAAQPGVDPLAPLLQLGLPAATGILYGVRAEPAGDQPSPRDARAGQNSDLKGPVTRYIVDFFVRGQDLVLNPNAQGARSSSFLLGLKAYDRDGNALNWAANQQSVEIQPDQFDMLQRKGIPVHLTIDLPAAPGIHLVTAVYDLNSGIAGTLEIPLQPNP